MFLYESPSRTFLQRKVQSDAPYFQFAHSKVTQEAKNHHHAYFFWSIVQSKTLYFQCSPIIVTQQAKFLCSL